MMLIKKILTIWFALPEKIRFLLVGGFNTVSGYLIFSFFTFYLQNIFNNAFILIATYGLSVPLSFCTLKIFVFQTTGNWLKEFIKILNVYVASYFLNLILLYLFTMILLMNIYISQALALSVMAVTMYLIHRFFTFKKS